MIFIILPLISAPLIYDPPREDLKEGVILEKLDLSYGDSLARYSVEVDSIQMVIALPTYLKNYDKFSKGDNVIFFGEKWRGHNDDLNLEAYGVSDIKKSNDIYWPDEKIIINKIYASPSQIYIMPIVLLLCPISSDDCSIGDKFISLIGVLAFVGLIIFSFKNRHKKLGILIAILIFLIILQLIVIYDLSQLSWWHLYQ